MSISRLINLLRRTNIHDNIVDNVLSIRLDNNQAVVKYEKNDDYYDLIHTDIPEEYQGHGLGTVFAERIFNYFIEKQQPVKLTCEFLEYCYKKNQEQFKNLQIKQ